MWNMTERSGHVLTGEDAPGATSPPAARAPLAEVVDYLVREVSAGACVLGVIGSPASGTHEVLDRLGACLAGSRRTLRIRGGILFPDELASRLLVELQAPVAADARAAFEARARAFAAAGQPIVLELEDGDALLPQTARWLATLTGPPQPAIRIVVACQLEGILRRSFPPEIVRIEVVRLAEVAASARTHSQVERLHRTNETTPLGSEFPASDEIRFEFVPGRYEPLIVLPESPPEEERALPTSASVTRLRPVPVVRAEDSTAARPRR